MDALLHDLRSAVRSLTKARGFTAVAVVVFALGIGINTALFSFTNALFFRSLPVNRPEQLVYLYDVSPAGGRERFLPLIDEAAFQYFRKGMRDVFSSVAGHALAPRRLTVDNQTEVANGEFVTGEYFELLGVTPQLGRALTQADEDPSTAAFAMVISDRLWERRFKRDPAVIGRRVRLCCRMDWWTSPDVDPIGEFHIVGVMRPSFRGVTSSGNPADFWTSAADFWQSATWLRGRGFAPIGRLADGVTVQQAQAAVRQRGEVLLADRRARAGLQAGTLPERRFEALAADDVFDPFSPRSTILQRQAATLSVVVAIVLLIAASNVAGLLIARGANRTAETAVRMILGGSRGRIIRLLLSESLVLASAGGVLGLLIAFWLLRLIHAYTPPSRLSVDTPLDARVLAITAAMCIGVGVLSGLTPALRAVRINLPGVLPGSALTPSKRMRTRLRHFILIPQVALSLALLVIAGFHVRSLARTEMTDLGYETADRVTLSVGLQPQRGDPAGRAGEALRARRSRDFYRQLLPRLQNVPGATAVAVAAAVPLSAGIGAGAPVAIAEETFADGTRSGPAAGGSLVSPGYFRAMGIRMVSGRDFDDREMRLEGPNGSTIVPAPLTAIVSESLAQRLWNGRSPLGRRLAITSTAKENANAPIDWLEVIGVVEDVRPVMQQSDADTPYVYLPMGQQWYPYAAMVIAHVPRTPATSTSALTQAVAGAHGAAEVYQARTLDQQVAEILFQTRMITWVLATSGLIGLLLASVGLYGVIWYSVTRRIRELGLRCALGASRADIVGLVMREGATVAAIGMVIGGWLAYAALRAGMNTPIRTDVDPVTMAIVPAVLAIAVLFACYIPARRAARVDPLESLRTL